MKTWQKILATLGIVFVMVVFDVIRKENGIVLGGLGNVICYGVFLAAIGFVWKLKRQKTRRSLKTKMPCLHRKYCASVNGSESGMRNKRRKPRKLNGRQKCARFLTKILNKSFKVKESFKETLPMRRTKDKGSHQ